MLVINNGGPANQILNVKQVRYEIIDYTDVTSNWEKDIIHKYKEHTILNLEIEKIEENRIAENFSYFRR